jgi:hypothetical protein
MEFRRQGDVGIIRRDDLDETILEGATEVAPDERGAIVLAEGETSGHTHRIAARTLAALYVLQAAMHQKAELADHARLLHVQEPTTIIHEEHGEIQLDPGYYEVRGQQELRANMIQRVLD